MIMTECTWRPSQTPVFAYNDDDNHNDDADDDVPVLHSSRCSSWLSDRLADIWHIHLHTHYFVGQIQFYINSMNIAAHAIISIYTYYFAGQFQFQFYIK